MSLMVTMRSIVNFLVRMISRYLSSIIDFNFSKGVSYLANIVYLEVQFPNDSIMGRRDLSSCLVGLNIANILELND